MARRAVRSILSAMSNCYRLQWVTLAFAGALCSAPNSTLADPRGKTPGPAPAAQESASARGARSDEKAVGERRGVGASAREQHAAAGKRDGVDHDASAAHARDDKAMHKAEGGSEGRPHANAEPADRAADPNARGAHGRADWGEVLEHARALAKPRSGGDEASAKAEREHEQRSWRERAEKHRTALRQEFAEIIKNDAHKQALSQELRHHARRTAKLARIRALAETKGDSDALARVDALLEREFARHDAKVARMRAETSATSGSEAAKADPANVKTAVALEQNEVADEAHTGEK